MANKKSAKKNNKLAKAKQNTKQQAKSVGKLNNSLGGGLLGGESTNSLSDASGVEETSDVTNVVAEVEKIQLEVPELVDSE